MGKWVKRLLFWIPRLLGLLFAAFITLFALDVFGEGYGLWETIVALFMHLLPTILLLLVLVLAWRWEWAGGSLFIALGLAYLWLAWGKFDWITYLIVSGPLFLVGALFLINWRFRDQLHDRA
mgnify:FL=1